MNNLFLATSVVLPLFIMMGLGYILKKIKIFDQQFLKQLNNLCFKIFLPLFLFVNIYNSDFEKAFDIKLIIFAAVCVFILFAILMIIIPKIEKDNLNKGVIIQGIFRSNFILFGIPIAQSIYGSENIATTSILVAFVIPLFNMLSVVALNAFSDVKQSPVKILKDILSNPLIIASGFAMFFVITKIKIPYIIQETIVDISSIASPLALIVLGGSFNLKALGNNNKALFISVIGKLIIVPLIFIFISVLFDFKQIQLVSLMAMFASPTAVSTFTMAQNAKLNDELASQIVVINSILSIFTIFIWISILNVSNLL